MGNKQSRKKKNLEHKVNYKNIGDNFTSYLQLEEALREAGVEACQLIVGVDFTKWNTWQGKGSFEYDNFIFVYWNTLTFQYTPYYQYYRLFLDTITFQTSYILHSVIKNN